eukprot:4741945-Pyramimonas_sp.AAC.1
MTTTEQPQDNPGTRDNHGTTRGQPRDNRWTIAGHPLGNHGIIWAPPPGGGSNLTAVFASSAGICRTLA